MATITSNLRLDTTFQRFLIDFMRAPATLVFTPFLDGTGAILTSSPFPDQIVHLSGIGLTTDAFGNPVGQLTAISIANIAGTAATSITGLPGTRLEDLLSAAQDGTGPASQNNFADFYFSLTLTQNLSVSGTKFDDLIEGGTGGSDDILSGKQGNDTFILGFGNDQIKGGQGNDTLQVTDTLFNPHLKVNLKVDTAEANTVVSTLDSIENVKGTGFRDIIKGDKKANVLDGFGGIDKLFGFGGDDELNGGKGKDWLKGGGGDDILNGGRGIDRLFGGEGDDILIGRKGDDILSGGGGDDTMTGGPGRDTFVFGDDAKFGLNGDDVITDFKANETISIFFVSPSDVSVAQVGADTVITYDNGTDTITLQDINLSKSDIDFLFL